MMNSLSSLDKVGLDARGGRNIGSDPSRGKPAVRGSCHGQGCARLLQNTHLMALLQFARKTAVCWLVASVGPMIVHGQSGFVPEAGEYGISGGLPGEQVWPHLSLRQSGGYVVWEDNATDGNGQGVSARRLDGSLVGTLSSFRVNEVGNGDQNRPQVTVLNDGGAAFVWQGGPQGFQRVYARFLSSAGTWVAGDVRVNTFTNNSQREPAIATLNSGNVVVTWSSFDQEAPGSLWGVYAQRLNPTGQPVGGEFRVNQTTAFNQRSSAIAPLSDGRFVVVWISEQQRFENSVDVYARIFTANGVGGNEFIVNTGTNVCANPSVAPSADGGFMVAWMQKDVQERSNSWDAFARPFSGGGFGGVVRRVNTHAHGDQLAPKISAIGSDYLVVWTSMAQDGSREGIYGQFLRADGSLVGDEFRVNTTTVSQQIHPAVASDGNGRFLAVWTSFVGGVASFDLFGQRYARDEQPLSPPDAPYVTVLGSNALSVTWPDLAGFNVASYEIFADGAATASAVVTNNWWTMTGLAPASSHSFRLAYVLADGRRSPLSGATTNTTYGSLMWGGIPYEWMTQFYGTDLFAWPAPSADADGDGATTLDEFRAGTNPTNSLSALRVRLEATPQGAFLHWNTQPGLIYQVQQATDLSSWSNFGGPRFAAGTVDSMFVGLSSTGYYRVERLR